MKRRVKVCETATMEDVRLLILEKGFDDILLPDGESDSDWSFIIDGRRLPSKHEHRQLAWDFIHNDIRIESKKRKLSPSSTRQQPLSTILEKRPASSHNDNVNKNYWQMVMLRTTTITMMMMIWTHLNYY